MQTILYGVLYGYLTILGLVAAEVVVGMCGLIRDYPRYRLGDFSVIDAQCPAMKARYRR